LATIIQKGAAKADVTVALGRILTGGQKKVRYRRIFLLAIKMMRIKSLTIVKRMRYVAGHDARTAASSEGRTVPEGGKRPNDRRFERRPRSHYEQMADALEQGLGAGLLDRNR
jgi:hypothetical protein